MKGVAGKTFSKVKSQNMLEIVMPCRVAVELQNNSKYIQMSSDALITRNTVNMKMKKSR